jgi:hypothetical protein
MFGTDGKTGTPFSNANAHLVVGTGSGAANAADTIATFTAAVGSPMTVAYPTMGTQKITWKTSYGSTDANQAWGEFGEVSGTPIASALLFNRKVSAQGTKVAGQVWELELAITLT